MNDARLPCTGQWRLFDAEHLGDVREAKRLCYGCPIREACLIKALRDELRAPVNMRQGVFGGASRDERHQIATKGRGFPGAHRLQHLALGTDPEECEQCTAAAVQVAA